MIKINLLQTLSYIIEKINVFDKGYVQKKVDALNKKAKKFGCKPLKLSFGPDQIQFASKHGNTVFNPDAYEAYLLKCKEQNRAPMSMRKYVTCLAKLEYEVPVIKGWELICTFDIVPMGKDEIEVFTSKVPGKLIPIEYQNKKEIHCDHCGHNRFRNHSMLMRNVETGEFKEVGSTCVKDFFGHDPRGFMMYARFSFDFPTVKEIDPDQEYEYHGQGYRMGCDDLMAVLTTTNAVIENHGWTSATVAYEYNKRSTKNRVAEQLNPPTNYIKMGIVLLDITEKDKEVAKATIEHFANLSAEEIGDNDYLMNCHKVAKHSMLPWKLFGVGVSMISAYNRFLKGEAEKAKRASEPESNFVGELKERLKDIPVTLVYSRDIFTDFGESVLYIWKDAQGNKFKTFYSGSKWSMEDKETGILTGTVKKHENYKGEKSTMLTRCVVKDIKTVDGEDVGFGDWNSREKVAQVKRAAEAKVEADKLAKELGIEQKDAA